MTRRDLFQSALGAAAAKGWDSSLTGEARQIFARINELRMARGAPEMRWSEAIAQCALEQSERKVCCASRDMKIRHAAGLRSA
jgi:uncharacterized protein YkwD